jgi:hypothetical protein
MGEENKVEKVKETRGMIEGKLQLKVQNKSQLEKTKTKGARRVNISISLKGGGGGDMVFRPIYRPLPVSKAYLFSSQHVNMQVHTGRIHKKKQGLNCFKRTPVTRENSVKVRHFTSQTSIRSELNIC